MSPVCHNFVQNAWKKDFCSNCFKSRDEHVKQDRNVETSTSQYLTSQLHHKTSHATSAKSVTSILKVNTKKKFKRNVRFPEEVCSVIGFGGDGWSDEEEFQMSEDNDDDDDTFPDTEEERELHRITKSNTDFNTVKANLLSDSGTKPYTSLLLGKVQTDSDGKKKTLLVSVTPFGQETTKSTNVKSHTRKPAVIHLSNLPVDETSNNYKTNIVLSTYNKESESNENSNLGRNTEGICSEKSLLEEISETLKQNRITAGSDINLTEADCMKPTVVEETIKEEETKYDENEKKDPMETRKNSLVRNSPITKNQERPKVNLSSRSEFKFCKINVESSSVDSAVSALNSTEHNSDDDSFSGRTDSDNDDSGNFSETHKNEETVQIKVFNDKEINNTKLKQIDHIRKIEGQSNPISTYSTFQSPILDMPPIIPKMENDVFSVQASRELAGEPDGRADPDEPMEAPALPKSPMPTMDARPSFLHGIILDSPINKPVVPEKPKLPVKPLTVIKQSTTKKNFNFSNHQQVIMQLHQTMPTFPINSKLDDKVLVMSEEQNNEITEVQDKTEAIYYAKPVLTKQDSDTSLNKRKAPIPPSSPTIEDYSNNMYQRNPAALMKSDSPVIREKEKRERAITNIPGQKNKVTDESFDQGISNITPEPAPRRNISLSHDNLLLDEKRNKKLKFSIKKLLRIGSSKDLDKKDLSIATVSKVSCKTEEIYDLTPKPKPRLVIIHPLDINGSNVEVVKSNYDTAGNFRRMSDEISSIYSGSSFTTDTEIPKITNKPPPPPRHSSEESKGITSHINKPARPPPPKSIILQKKQKQQTWTSTPSKGDNNIYANLGEVRSALTPRKPERTASMREREAHLELPKRRNSINDNKDDVDDICPEGIVQAKNETVINTYDDVYNSTKYDNSHSVDDNMCDSAKNSDSDYEYVNHGRSSSPECDSAVKNNEMDTNRHRISYEVKDIIMRKNDIENNSDFQKFNNVIFNRSSLPYCGSETESEIYSPYSFYSSADGMDNSGCNDDYQNDMTSKTTNKLRVRKGRSIVHKNLEDNYGAVVIANHEALAQVLEQVC